MAKAVRPRRFEWRVVLGDVRGVFKDKTGVLLLGLALDAFDKSAWEFRAAC